MSEFVQSRVANRTGIITLDRLKALNSLSLAMVRDLAEVLHAWRDDSAEHRRDRRPKTQSQDADPDDQAARDDRSAKMALLGLGQRRVRTADDRGFEFGL